MQRKPMPSAVLKTLPDEDQAALFDFLRDHTLEEGVPFVMSEHGIRTNKSSLGEWRGWYEMQRRINGWNVEVEKLQELLRTDKTIDPNLVPKIGEAVFLSRAAEEGDAKAFALVASIIQRHKELENQQIVHADKMKVEDQKLNLRRMTLAQAKRKIQLQERRIKALEATANKARESLADNSLTEQQRAAKMRALFGV